MSDPRAGGKLVARDTRPPFVTEHTTSPHCDLPQGPDLSGCLTPMTCLTSLRHQSEVTRGGGSGRGGCERKRDDRGDRREGQTMANGSVEMM